MSDAPESIFVENVEYVRASIADDLQQLCDKQAFRIAELEESLEDAVAVGAEVIRERNTAQDRIAELEAALEQKRNVATRCLEAFSCIPVTGRDTLRIRDMARSALEVLKP